MKKKNKFLLLIIFMTFFACKNTYAFDVNNYRSRELCGNFEVAGFHSDGVIEKKECFNDYNSAKNYMKTNGGNDLALMTKVNGETKIIDANMALVDLSVNPAQLTYFYENSELTSRIYTYMDTGSLYGGVDGGLLDSSYSNSKGKWVIKVRTGNFTGWIEQQTYEIVPLTWLKSYSSYTVTNEYIRHNYVTKIQNEYKSSGASTIGPKPEMLNVGTYYSYDGHYFYDNIEKLMKDYKNNNYDNAVNKTNAYYNYYMYLSNHTRTAYSSINIDEYIRNNLGIKKDAYGHYVKGKSNEGSRLYGSGNFFYYAQEKYGVNALLALSLSRNETGNGRSQLAINKNNGFGLDAVDSNPINGAKSYPTYPASILGYASKWITYGYAHPRDGRYFGPQFGDKWIGMNVKYASDTYWSEKMASNYFSMDKALGLQDYNYYQLGVLKNKANAYSQPSTSSKFIYEYPEAEDAVVIVDEVQKSDGLWYKVVSDLNIDQNYNEITSGNYNWNGYVYVKADNIKKINKGKNGYVSPNDVTEYQNQNYEYDLYTENGEFKPKVGISTKNTPYYYDSSLQSKNGQTLLKDRYVMIHATAMLNGKAVAHLVTSDYFYDQKHWVSADSIKITATRYGRVTVDTTDNQYTWVNYNTEDKAYSKIGGLYTNAYVPILGEVQVGSDLWYKVPVSLTSNSNVEGYTLSKFSNYIHIDVYNSTKVNTQPTITATDKTVIEGSTFDAKSGVKANDAEDGDLTSQIQVSGTVNTSKPGTYKITYSVTDTANSTVTKEITVTVKANNAPVITAKDVVLTINQAFDSKAGVTAKDAEDGDITSKIKVTSSNVNTKVAGTYKVVYEVTDSHGKKATKEIKVQVVKDKPPVINAEDTIAFLDDEFDPFEDVTATDAEDGDITKNLKVKSSNVNTNKVGTYQVTYQVTDSSNNTVTKTINVEVVDLNSIVSDSLFYFDYLKEVNKKLEIKGYNVIKGMNNTLDKEIRYFLVLINTQDEEDEGHVLEMTRITNKAEMTRPVNSKDNYDYTYSWFKGTIDTSDIPDGDYQMVIMSVADNKMAGALVSNKVLKPQAASFKDTKYITTRNNYFDESIPLELIIRSKQIGTKNATSTYNQYNQYRTLEFTNNRLHIKGTSYSYGMNLATTANVDRKIIFENTKTYAQYTYNLGSITNGLYQVGTTLNDKLNKTRAWFDATIDISNLPKGNYAIYISNKANISDYGELNELLQRNISKIKMTTNNKTYSFKVNKDLRYRIELNVE